MSKQNLTQIHETGCNYLEVAITREIAAKLQMIGDISKEEEAHILFGNILWEYQQLVSQAKALQSILNDLQWRQFEQGSYEVEPDD